MEIPSMDYGVKTYYETIVLRQTKFSINFRIKRVIRNLFRSYIGIPFSLHTILSVLWTYVKLQTKLKRTVF